MKVTKQARFITVTRMQIHVLRKKIPEFDPQVVKWIKSVNETGLPLLDYTVKRPRVLPDGTIYKFDARQTLIDSFWKVEKIKRFKSMKNFKFTDLLNFLKRSQFSEAAERGENAEAMLENISSRL